jgi:hypothetical protein
MQPARKLQYTAVCGAGPPAAHTGHQIGGRPAGIVLCGIASHEATLPHASPPMNNVRHATVLIAALLRCASNTCASAAATPSSPRSSSLSNELTRLIFMNNGTVTKADVFEYVPMKISYNEPDNVTCSECGWAVHTPWHYIWMRDANKPPPPPPPPRPPPPPPPHPGASPAEVCAKACCDIGPTCVGFLFEGHADTNVCGKSDVPCCWLKSALTLQKGAKPASVNATVFQMHRTQQQQGGTCTTTVACTNCDAQGADIRTLNPLHPLAPPPSPPSPPQPNNVVAPPMGIRSSPALGGVSTGSTELRADGCECRPRYSHLASS